MDPMEPILVPGEETDALESRDCRRKWMHRRVDSSIAAIKGVVGRREDAGREKGPIGDQLERSRG